MVLYVLLDCWQQNILVVSILSKCWGYNVFYHSNLFSPLAGMHIPLEPNSSPITIPGPCSSHCSPHCFAHQEDIALPGSELAAT